MKLIELVESPAPGIIDEQSICEPVCTGSIIYRFHQTVGSDGITPVLFRANV